MVKSENKWKANVEQMEIKFEILKVFAFINCIQSNMRVRSSRAVLFKVKSFKARRHSPRVPGYKLKLATETYPSVSFKSLPHYC